MVSKTLERLVVTKHDRERDIKIHSILGDLGISTSVLFLIGECNPSAYKAYHGYQHLVTTAINADLGARKYGFDRSYRRAIVLAALFHDHSHGLRAALNPHDAELNNVQEAIKQWGHLISNRYDEKFKVLVGVLIEATFFPHNPPRSVLQAIIQDADLLQTLEPDGTRFLKGLNEEDGVQRTPAQDRKFLEAHPFNTEWASGLVTTHFKKKVTK